MAEEPPNSEDIIKEFVQEAGITESQGDEERIAKIISKTRRNVGTRDFILLIFVRFWVVLAEITCTVIARQSKETNMNPAKKPVKP